MMKWLNDLAMARVMELGNSKINCMNRSQYTKHVK